MPPNSPIPCLLASTMKRTSLCFVLVTLVAFSTSAGATRLCSGSDDAVAVTAMGPGFTNSTDVTQCGVVDLEYGWSRAWQNAGPTQQTLTTSLRLGLARNLDLRWGFDALQLHPSVSEGLGDNWLGARYRFHSQGKSMPALAIMYTAKIATASPALGFGSGFNDQSLALLVSKDFGRFHADTNLIRNWAGRGNGWDENLTAAVAGSVLLRRHWTVSSEAFGATRQNAITPGYASVGVGLSYSVSARTIVYAGYAAGVSGGSGRHLNVGMAYSIGKLYKSALDTRVGN